MCNTFYCRFFTTPSVLWSLCSGEPLDSVISCSKRLVYIRFSLHALHTQVNARGVVEPPLCYSVLITDVEYCCCRQSSVVCRSVCWLVCLYVSVGLSVTTKMPPKWLYWSRCHLGCGVDLGGPKEELCIRWEVQIADGKEYLWERMMVGFSHMLLSIISSGFNVRISLLAVDQHYDWSAALAMECNIKFSQWKIPPSPQCGLSWEVFGRLFFNNYR